MMHYVAPIRQKTSIAFIRSTRKFLNFHFSPIIKASPFTTNTIPKDNPSPSVSLYQYHICPFCNYAKAVMSYAKVSFQPIEVNPLTKAELKPWSDYKKVPIAIIDEKQVNGSDEIIQALLQHPKVSSSLEAKWLSMNGDNGAIMTMDKFMNSKEAIQWSLFAKEELAPVLYPNICRTFVDSYDAFSYVQNVNSFSWMQKALVQNIGSFAMYIAASKIKAKRNIIDERESLHSAISRWEKEGLDDGAKLFCSGNLPNLGDIAVFGVIHSIQGLQTHEQIIQKRGGTIQEWYERCLSHLNRD